MRYSLNGHHDILLVGTYPCKLDECASLSTAYAERGVSMNKATMVRGFAAVES
jgi:hypothetical protein